MQIKNYQIRPEREKDRRETECLTREAFWNKYQPGCTEHYVLHRFRNLPEFVSELNYVIEYDGKIVAHIMYSHAKIFCDNGDEIPILVFGPVSVLPVCQRKGFGSALIQHTMEKAESMGFGAVAITGNPEYYGRFGFSAGKAFQVFYKDMPREADTPFFMIKELKSGFLNGVSGVYQDPDGYETTEEEVDAFDALFPPKEKRSCRDSLDKARKLALNGG